MKHFYVLFQLSRDGNFWGLFVIQRINLIHSEYSIEGSHQLKINKYNIKVGTVWISRSTQSLDLYFPNATSVDKNVDINSFLSYSSILGGFLVQEFYLYFYINPLHHLVIY